MDMKPCFVYHLNIWKENIKDSIGDYNLEKKLWWIFCSSKCWFFCQTKNIWASPYPFMFLIYWWINKEYFSLLNLMRNCSSIYFFSIQFFKSKFCLNFLCLFRSFSWSPIKAWISQFNYKNRCFH